MRAKTSPPSWRRLSKSCSSKPPGRERSVCTDSAAISGRAWRTIISDGQRAKYGIAGLLRDYSSFRVTSGRS